MFSGAEQLKHLKFGPVVVVQRKSDWVDHQACELLQYIDGVTIRLVMGNYFRKLR